MIALYGIARFSVPPAVQPSSPVYLPAWPFSSTNKEKKERAYKLWKVLAEALGLPALQEPILSRALHRLLDFFGGIRKLVRQA